jgi:hypothetical protein
MKRKATVIGVATVVAGVLAACGHDDNHPGSTTTTTPQTPPPTTTAIDVSTAELLANYASQPSETDSPVSVNGGAFNITDTSETTTPISVDGT